MTKQEVLERIRERQKDLQAMLNARQVMSKNDQHAQIEMVRLGYMWNELEKVAEWLKEGE